VKTLVFCGHSTSGCEAIYQGVVGMGLTPPRGSARGGMLPDELQDKLLKLSGIDASGDWLPPDSPGALWLELATDFFLANVDAAQWGWSDSRHAPFLHFWGAFDSQIRFVLLYTPPEYALSAALHSGRPPLDAVEAAVADWTRFNQVMLRFYMANQDRCLLVNTRSAQFSGAHFADMLNDRFSMGLLSEHWLGLEQPADALEALVARQMLAEYPAASDVYQSLESMADLPFGDDSGALEVSNAARQLRHHESQLRDRDRGHAAERASWAKELQQCNQRLEQEEQAWAAKLSALESEARQQQDGLLRQLLQSQEELDSYAVRIAQVLGAQAPQATDSVSQTCAAIEQGFDVRVGFAGDNWYGAEDDGRWAGPRSVSTVRLPALAAAAYALSLDVAASMAPDILEGMRLYLHGREIVLQGAAGSCPVLLYGEFSVPESDSMRIVELQFQFPRTLSPAAEGLDTNDHRELAIRLRGIDIRALAKPETRE
jgi:hypothetical protein